MLLILSREVQEVFCAVSRRRVSVITMRILFAKSVSFVTNFQLHTQMFLKSRLLTRKKVNLSKKARSIALQDVVKNVILVIKSKVTNILLLKQRLYV